MATRAKVSKSEHQLEQRIIDRLEEMNEAAEGKEGNDGREPGADDRDAASNNFVVARPTTI